MQEKIILIIISSNSQISAKLSIKEFCSLWPHKKWQVTGLMALSSFQRSPSIGTNFVKIRTNNLYCAVLALHTCWPRESPIKTRSESVLSGVLSRSQKMFSLLLLPSAALAWAPAPGLVLSSIFFSIWRKFGRSFKHLWRDVRPPCRPTSWLCLFSWFSSIRDQVGWPAYDHDHEWINFFEMLTIHMQGSFLRFTRIKQMFWIEVLFWDLYTLICHQNHTSIKL